MLQAKAKARREAAEKESEAQREKLRINMGKEMAAAYRQEQEMKLQRLADERKRDKEEMEAARAKLKAKMEEDRYVSVMPDCTLDCHRLAVRGDHFVAHRPLLFSAEMYGYATVLAFQVANPEGLECTHDVAATASFNDCNEQLKKCVPERRGEGSWDCQRSSHLRSSRRRSAKLKRRLLRKQRRSFQ